MIEPHGVERRDLGSLLKTPIPDSPSGRKPIRLIACGVPVGVNGIVHQLHVLNFAEVGEWTLPLPSSVSGEVIRILTRHIIISD